MKRFSLISAVIGGGMVLAALALKVVSFDVLSLQTVLTSDGRFDDVTLYAIGGLPGGLLLAGVFLLVLSVILRAIENETIPLLGLPIKYYLSIIIAAQLILGLIYVLNVTYIPHEDYEWYHRQASNLASGLSVTRPTGEPTAYWPVGYPIFLSLIYRVFGSHMVIAQVLNVVLACLVTLLTYFFCRRLFDEETAKRAALINALLPSWIFISLLPNADILFSLLILTALYLTYRDSTPVNTLLTGLSLGFATLTRAVSVFFPIFIAAYRYLTERRWKGALGQMFLLFLLVEAVLFPWQVRNYRVFGKFVLVSTNGGRHVWMGNNPNASGGYMGERSFVPREVFYDYSLMNEIEKDRYAFRQGIKWALQNPLQAVSIWPKKVIQLYLRDSKGVTYGLHEGFEQLPPYLLMAFILLAEGYYYALGAAFLLGLWMFWKKDKWSPRFGLLIGTVVYFTAIHLPFIAEGRYHMPLLPLFAMIACFTPPNLPSSKPY